MAKGVKQEDQAKTVLFDGFEILTDDYNYSLIINTGRRDKEGRLVYKYLSYHGTFDKALAACKKEYTKRQLMSAGITNLDEAVSIIVRSNNHFEALIKNAFEGVES